MDETYRNGYSGIAAPWDGRRERLSRGGRRRNLNHLRVSNDHARDYIFIYFQHSDVVRNDHNNILLFSPDHHDIHNLIHHFDFNHHDDLNTGSVLARVGVRPFELNGGETYLITYYKYDYKIQPNQSAPIYEYIVEKSVRKDKIHVYGQDMQGNKVDLGEQEVYAYETIVTPVKAASMDDTLKITMWFASNKSQVFLYPWDAMWMAYLSPTVQDKTFVGVKFEYKGKSALFTNPAPFQSGLFPYFEGGDQDAFNDVNEDLGYLYMGWLATLNFGIWYAWEDVNLLVPQSGGVWSDMQGGHSWEWSTKPDGSATYGGHSFKLVDFSWKYKGTAEQVSMNGKGRLSPYLPARPG